MKNFLFLSGVPRSGSTVFATIISQNPNIYTTPTSPLLDFLLSSKPTWKEVSSFQKNNHPEQYKNIERGIINGCYEHIKQPFVLDKHRSWPKYSSYIEETFKIKPKIVCTTRRISEVLASFILIINKSKRITYIDRELMNNSKPINNKTRCKLLWENYISVPWKSLKIGYETSLDSLCFIDYSEIIRSPKETLKKVYNFWGIEMYDNHSFTDLINPQPENDSAYGIDELHNIRKELKKQSPPPEEVLGKELCDYYDSLKLEFWKPKV